LNKNYGLGLIMFHYNLYGLTANNPDNLSSTQINSPYDAPIVNANYVSLSPTFKLDKWSFHLTGVAAWATETAPNYNSTTPQKFYNHQRRQWFDTTYGNGNQQSFMGWEVDGGTTFKWDDHYVMDWTVGFFFPGAYYKFANNTAPFHENSVSSFMFASQLRAGITF
jgi:hypothetical protein